MDRKTTRAFALITHLGITVIVPIVLMIYFGKFLSRFITSDIVMLVCIILGILAGLRNGYLLLKVEVEELNKEIKSRRREELDKIKSSYNKESEEDIGNTVL